MKYYLELSLKYMGKHWSRTIYTSFGIMLTFLLVFAALTTGYAIWECTLELCYSGEQGRTQLGISECTKEDIEKVSKYVSVSEVVIRDMEDDMLSHVSLEELEENHSYYAFIGLKDTSNLQKSAQELRDNLNLEIYVDEEIEMYLNQGDSLERSLYNSGVVILGAIFALFSILILRNIMMISVVERMQDYGLMRCVGMSQKQIYSLLMMEGLVMGICGAVGGICCGYGILQIVGVWLNPQLNMPVAIHFGLYPKAILYTTLLCLASILYSLLEPARQAGIISPIEALHNNITLKNSKGKIRETIHYHSGRLWGKLFGASGEYAYKNMMRNRGRFVYLFVGMLVCMCLTGSIYSFTDSVLATVEKTYEGEHREFAEIIGMEEEYSEERYNKICSDLKKIDGVQKVGLILQSIRFNFYDPKLIKQNVHMCIQYAYDKEHFEKLKPYLTEGEISFEKMEKENGVLLCDSVYHVRDDEGNFSTQRITDYKVGDTISLLSVDGYEKANAIFSKYVKQAAKNKKIHTVTVEKDWIEPYEAAPESYDSELPGFKRLLKETIRLLKENGYDVCSLREYTEYTRMYQVKDDLEHLLFQQGETDQYVIQGIVSEDIFNGGDDYDDSSNIRLLQPDTTVLSDASQIDTKRFGFYWSIGLTRDIEKLDNSIQQYCTRESTEERPMDFYSGVDEYVDMLSTLRVAEVAALLVGGCIALISFIQIFNTVCASMCLRRKELWLYEVVGMSRSQERRMVVLENSVAAFLAVVVGYLLSWGISWYFVEYLLNQDESIQYVYSAGKNMVLAVILFVLSVIASLWGRKFARRGGK